MEYVAGSVVVAYFKVAMPDHRFDMVPHTGTVVSISKKTALVEVSGRNYRVKFENLRLAYDETNTNTH